MDEETGLYYYGARYYDPKISIWLSVDPLMEKHPNMNPYVYCLQNPISMIDPDGRDGVRIIDNTNKTITIKATYFVQTQKSPYYTTTGKMKTIDGYTLKDIDNMQTDYNKYLNDLSLVVGEGEYKDYAIKFDLQFKDGGTIDQSKNLAKNEMFEGYSIGNSLVRGNGESYPPFKQTETDNEDGTFSMSPVRGGVTDARREILMNSSKDNKMNRIHEIFHTFYFTHPKNKGGSDGIMKYPPETPNQNDANRIGSKSCLPVINLE